MHNSLLCIIEIFAQQRWNFRQCLKWQSRLSISLRFFASTKLAACRNTPRYSVFHRDFQPWKQEQHSLAPLCHLLVSWAVDSPLHRFLFSLFHQSHNYGIRAACVINLRWSLARFLLWRSLTCLLVAQYCSLAPRLRRLVARLIARLPLLRSLFAHYFARCFVKCFASCSARCFARFFAWCFARFLAWCFTFCFARCFARLPFFAAAAPCFWLAAACAFTCWLSCHSCCAHFALAARGIKIKRESNFLFIDIV